MIAFGIFFNSCKLGIPRNLSVFYTRGSPTFLVCCSFSSGEGINAEKMHEPNGILAIRFSGTITGSGFKLSVHSSFIDN